MTFPYNVSNLRLGSAASATTLLVSANMLCDAYISRIERHCSSPLSDWSSFRSTLMKSNFINGLNQDGERILIMQLRTLRNFNSFSKLKPSKRIIAFPSTDKCLRWRQVTPKLLIDLRQLFMRYATMSVLNSPHSSTFLRDSSSKLNSTISDADCAASRYSLPRRLTARAFSLHPTTR